MGKVISFELKKLVSRIGIYILVALMAGSLVVTAFMHKPTERIIDNYILAGDTVSKKYDSFTEDMQPGYQSAVQQTAENASTYITSSADYLKYNNKQEIQKLFAEFDDYCRQYAEVLATEGEYAILQQGILISLDNLHTALDDTLEFSENKSGYYILSTQSNHTALFSVLDKINSNFKAPISHKLAGERYFKEYRTKLNDCLEALIYPNLNDTAKNYTTSGTYYSLINLRMEEVVAKMQAIADKVTESPILDTNDDLMLEMDELFNKYVNYSRVFIQAYSSDMCASAISSISSKTTRSNLVGYNKVSVYDESELAVEYKYHMTHNTFPSDFATGLSTTHTSNGKINAYDFSFFILSIFSIIVIIFAIYLSANTISGEINHNTMRFTAIRPVSRGSIFFGKYLSIIIMSFILLLFAGVTSFVTGGIIFGFKSANILMIINGSKVLIAHPALVLGIFMLNLLLTVALYSGIAMMLSCLIKSELLTLIIGIIFYAINIILPLFLGASSWLKFYPFTNINLFAYFNSTSLTNNSILAKLFNSVVYQGMNIWISLIYLIAITTIVLIVGKLVFRRREL